MQSTVAVRVSIRRGRLHAIWHSRARTDLVATVTLRRLGPPHDVCSLLAADEAAGIELRLFPTLWRYWSRVMSAPSASAAFGCATPDLKRANRQNEHWRRGFEPAIGNRFNRRVVHFSQDKGQSPGSA